MLLRRAAGLADNSPVRNGHSSDEWHCSQPPPPTPRNPRLVLPSFRRHNRGGQQSPDKLPQHDFESLDDPLTRTSEDGIVIATPPPPSRPPAPPPLAPPPLPPATASIRSSTDSRPLLAGKEDTTDTVRACHNSVMAGKGAATAMVDAAKKTRCVQTGDRARAVDGTAIWPRNEGGLALQPKTPYLIASPSSSKRVGFSCYNGEGGALRIEAPPRYPAGDDVGPRDETGGGGGGGSGFSVTFSARGAQTVTVNLSQCPSPRFSGKQAVSTAAVAELKAPHAVDGSRGMVDRDLDKARGPELFTTRPAESKDKRPDLHRSGEEVHHQGLRRVPSGLPRPQMSRHVYQAPSPWLPPSWQVLPLTGVACAPQKNKSFSEKLQRKIGPRQQPHPARSCNFRTGAKTHFEDIRDVAPPVSVLGTVERGASLRSYIDDTCAGDTYVLERGGYDDRRVPCTQPSSDRFVARHNVCSPPIESGGGDAGRWPCYHRLGNGYDNGQYIAGAPQREQEAANSSHTASPSGTTTIRKATVHPAGYRRWRRYDQRDDSGGETHQRNACDKTKTGGQSSQSGDSNTDRRGREDSSTRRRLPSAESTKSDDETADMAGVREDDSFSCALARKRALVRVRLARQQNSLAAAVADANERGFRAERRRKRAAKLAALLLKTFGCGVIDSSRHVERRPLSSQDDENGREGGGGESGSSPTGVRMSSE